MLPYEDKCSTCSGRGIISTWLWWRKLCPTCSGRGIVPGRRGDPLAGLTETQRRAVLKRNPDPDELARLGIRVTKVLPPFRKS